MLQLKTAVLHDFAAVQSPVKANLGLEEMSCGAPSCRHLKGPNPSPPEKSAHTKPPQQLEALLTSQSLSVTPQAAQAVIVRDL
jgi:hypothetical protein